VAANWRTIRASVKNHRDLMASFLKDAEILPPFAALKRETARVVKSTQWYSDLAFDPLPSSFVIEDSVPGRRLAGKPARLEEFVSYGFDAQGRVRVECLHERNSTYASFTYWRHAPNHVDAFGARFHKPTRQILNGFNERTRLILNESKPFVGLRLLAGGIAKMFLYEHDGALVSQVIEATRNQKAEWTHILHTFQYVGNHLAGVTSQADWGETWRKKFRVPRAKVVRPKVMIDLRKQVGLWSAWIAGAVEKFSRQHHGSKKIVRVSGIGLEPWAYDGDGNAGAALHIDTRPVHRIDGEWTHSNVAQRICGQWGKLLAAARERAEGVAILDLKGKRRIIGGKENSDGCRFLGEMLVESLKRSGRERTFKKIERASSLMISVEDFDSGFAWSGKC